MTPGAPRAVLMKDVASRAGVSVTTVSFVLADRDDMRISEATRQKVLRAAHELDYRPNLIARSLVTKLTRTIGLVSDTIVGEGYAGDLIRGSLAAAVRLDHLLQIAETALDPTVEAKVIRHLIDHRVDGLIYASMSTRRLRLPKALAGQRTVLLNCVAGRETPAILPDDVQGGRTAVTTLLAAGHEEGIYLVGETPAEKLPTHSRRIGIDSAMADAGARLAGALPCTWWPESAFDAVTELLASGGRPRALICLNDRIAFGAYQALTAAGRTVPDDVSVISFDDSPLAAWLQPPLTSVAMPYLEMGRLAVETLLSEPGGPRLIRVPMPLRDRESVGRPHSADGSAAARVAGPRAAYGLVDDALGDNG